jgi:hypothetical protein
MRLHHAVDDKEFYADLSRRGFGITFLSLGELILSAWQAVNTHAPTETAPVRSILEY